MERYIDKFNYLVDSGYDRDILYNYFYVDDKVIYNIVDKIFNKFVKNLVKEEVPHCLIVGGQPGSGKSCFCSNFVLENSNYFSINMDNYRVYHPYYYEIRRMVLDKWGDDDGSSEMSPSNDFANITHYFVVRVNELLVDKLIKERYNIILEWNLRNSKGTLDFVRKLNKDSYVVDIVVIITSRYTSYQACNLRYEIMKDKDRLVRRVPKSFHDLCVEALISSLGDIDKVGYRENRFINNISCVLRDGTIIWKSGMNNISSTISKYLNSEDEDVINDVNYVKKMYDMENNLLN